jgi:hypothetical protein
MLANDTLLVLVSEAVSERHTTTTNLDHAADFEHGGQWQEC